MPDDDYSPIVEEGELDAGSGLRARLRRRQELTPVSPGFKRVLLDADGSPVTSDRQFTPGEKRYTRARRWARVDIRHHRLEHRLHFSDPSGHAGFDANIAVDASVSNPTAMFEYGGACSVKDVIVPALQRSISDVCDSGQAAPDSDDVHALARLRLMTQQQLRKLESKPLGDSPNWLTVSIQTVSVDFDDATQQHHDRLMRLEQQGQVIEASSKNEEKETAGKIKIRGLWRKDLLPRLSDSSQRVFEQVYANPTDANIAAAVTQANERELMILQEVLRSYENLAKDGFVDKDDPTIRALAGLVNRLPSLIAGAEPALPDGEERAGVYAAPPPEDQPGDRDFSD